MNMEAHVLRKNHTSVHYWSGGQAHAPLIVLTHGALIDHHEWDATVPVLGGRYRVLTWDLPGHGLSRPARFSISEAVDDLIAIIDGIGVDQACFVGHSLGGNLHQELVFQHAERVISMVCVGCTWNFQKLSRLESLVLEFAQPLFRLYPYRRLVEQALAATATSADSRELLRRAVTRLSKEEIVQVMVAATECLRHEPDYTINKPLLLVVGDQDRTGNIRKAMPIWARHEPKSTLVVVPHAKHAPNLDDPRTFHRELTSFLEAHAGPGMSHGDVTG
jgi:pimeloyl-ACP methyl ester carboxylesterase